MWNPVATCLAVVCAALLLAAARAEEEREVPRRGYAQPRIPPILNDPPSSYTRESHDIQDGVHYTGTGHYELRQGQHPDDKEEWAESDFIHWHAHGATIMSEGQSVDWDPMKATTVTAEAWGKTGAETNVQGGQKVRVRVKNRVQFEWDYLMSGAHIGEASVQLHGAACDVEGKKHSYTLSDHRSEETTQTREEEHGVSSEQHASVEGSVGEANGKPFFRVGGAAGTKTARDTRLHVSITRRLAVAGGDTGTSPEIILDTTSWHPTPYSGSWAVYSEGRVTLRTRASLAGEDEDEDERGPVLVRLTSFRVLNSLQVFVLVTDDDDPAPPTGVPPPVPPDDEPDDGTRAFDGVSLPGLGGLRARVSATSPSGLQAEPGSLPGLVGILLEAPAPEDARFSVEAVDPGRVVLPDRLLVVPAGSQWGSLPLHGIDSGGTEVVLSLLDGQGVATGDELRTAVETRSLWSEPAPRLWAGVPGKAWRPGEGVVVHAIRGRDAGPLWIGRTAFEGYASSDTVVSVGTDDPDGVLAPLPGSVTIPAGGRFCEVPLLLRDAEGTAVITLGCGDEQVGVTVVSRSQGWKAAPALRLPLGATAPLAFFLDHADSRALDVTASVGDGDLVALEPPGTTSILPGERIWRFEGRGDAPGETTVTISSPGLPDLPVRVVVCTPDVELSSGRLHLRDLPAGAEGTIRLTAPGGVVFSSLDLPPDSAEYLEVAGLGTSEVTLSFSPSPNLPRSLSLPITLVGDTAGALEITVLDAVHPPLAEGTLLPYRIVVR
jgi:hypothetical protein